MSRQPLACLVVLTDTLYLPGTRCLLRSWDTFNPPLPVIALSPHPAALADPFLIERCHARLTIDSERYETIPTYRKRRSRRHARTFPKFEAFADYGFERNVFLDSDMLCLNPCPALIMPDDALLKAALEPGFRKTRRYKGHTREINSGALVIDRSLQGRETVDALKAIAIEQPGGGGYEAGDQGIINKWIRYNQVPLELLPQEYNLVKKDYEDLSQLEGCRLLHFAACKPWFEQAGDATSPLAKIWNSAAEGKTPKFQR